MTFYSGDIDIFFSDPDAELVWHEGEADEKRFDIIFLDREIPMDTISGKIINANSQFFAPTADFSGIKRDDLVTIGAVVYYVREIFDEGTGITKVTVGKTA
jgi:hypothetical protein